MDDSEDCLTDMLRYAEIAVSVVETSHTAELSADSVEFLALLRAVQTIGEAARQVSPDLRARLGQIPWHEVIGMRHRLVHDYRRTRVDVVVKTVRQDLPPLISALQRALQDHG